MKFVTNPANLNEVITNNKYFYINKLNLEQNCEQS